MLVQTLSLPRAELKRIVRRWKTSMPTIELSDPERSLLERLPDPTCILGFDGAFRALNTIWERSFDVRADAICGVPFVEFVHPADRAAVSAALERAREGERIAGIESRLGPRAGAYRLSSWSAAAHAESASIYLSARALGETAERLRQFRAIAERTSDFVSIADAEGRVFYINPAGIELLGLSKDALAGLVIRDCRTEEGYRYFRNEITPILREKGRWSGETEFKHASGRPIPVSQVIFAISDEMGGAVVYATIVRDMSEVKHRESELRRFKASIEATTDYVAIFGRELEVIYMNPALFTLIGREPGEIIGYFLRDIGRTDTVRAIGDEVLPSVLEHGSWSGEITLQSVAGVLVPLMGVASAIRDEKGDIEGISIVARDVSAHKRVEVLEHAIRLMSTPILEVGGGVLLMPIIGIVDSRRASEMTEALLEAIVKSRCQTAILDLTGMETIDTSTLDLLFKLITASRLLGSRVLISGISPTIAQSISQLGVDLSELRTYRTLEQALLGARRAAR